MSSPSTAGGDSHVGEVLPCGAKTRAGGTCRNRPSKGRKRCPKHGGAQPRGPENANFKHGRYSAYWGKATGPLKLAKERADAEGSAILDLRPGIGLFDERIAELSRRLGLGDAPDWRTDVREAWANYLAKPSDALAGRLTSIIDEGARWDSCWDEVLSTVERRGKRAEAAIEREQRAAEALTKDQVKALLGHLLATIQTSFEPKIAARVVDVLERRIAAPALGIAPPPR